MEIVSTFCSKFVSSLRVPCKEGGCLCYVKDNCLFCRHSSLLTILSWIKTLLAQQQNQMMLTCCIFVFLNKGHCVVHLTALLYVAWNSCLKNKIKECCVDNRKQLTQTYRFQWKFTVCCHGFLCNWTWCTAAVIILFFFLCNPPPP